LIGPDGEKLTFVTARSEPFEGYSRVQFEILFGGDFQSGSTRVLSFQKWYFADNWVGRFQWSQIWRLFMVLSTALVVPVLSCFLVVRRLLDRFRAPRGFMVEPSNSPIQPAG
jgi:hypothetical protein